MSRPATRVQLPSAVDAHPFTRQVRALRAAAGLTHAEAADRAGLSVRWWYYLHAGTRDPRPADCEAVAHLDPLATPVAAAVLETLARDSLVPPAPALAVAHLAVLAGHPLATVSGALALAITPETLAATATARQRGAEALTRLEAMAEGRPLDVTAATTRVHLTAVLDRLDVILASLSADGAL